MAKFTDELLETLEKLSRDEFDKFKWYLKQREVLEGFSGIPAVRLDNVERQDTVDRMVQKYRDPGALKLTLVVLGKLDRNDLVQHLQNSRSGLKGIMSRTHILLVLGVIAVAVIAGISAVFSSSSEYEDMHPPFGAHGDFSNQKEEYERKHAELKSIQQFSVEVTLDPDTAHPHLILSQSVLGKQSFSTGRFYFEVWVEGKTEWTVGIASELTDREGDVTLCPENGVWTISLRKRDEYYANDSPFKQLSLKSPPKKVGVFVDYEVGLVSFYDAEAADHLYSFTGCSFIEKLYPFFCPEINGGGRNSAPLIISSVNDQLKLKKGDFSNQKEEYERKHAELKSIQQFSVEVTLDPDTAHPHLILSQSVLRKQSFSTGRFYFEVWVEGKTEWTVGIASELTDREGDVTLCPENGVWTISLRKRDEYYANDSPFKQLSLKSPPKKVGVFVDYEVGLVSFYDAEAADHLYSFTGCSFIEKLYPVFCPEINGGGRNSAPLIISSVNDQLKLKKGDFSNQKEEYERKHAELKSIQLFSVEVTLDPDTAHPHLILSHNGKQVHHGDESQILPYNPKRFMRLLNVLGKQSFSTGRFYFEVQVEGKTEWTVGIASESTDREGDVTLCPENGVWTISLRKRDEYYANDSPFKQLSLKSPPKKVGVFVDYEVGLVSFYDAEAADHLYSFTGCSFIEKLYPFFCPGINGGGRNSIPLIICPVNHRN